MSRRISFSASLRKRQADNVEGYPAYDKGMNSAEWKRDRVKMIERCISILTNMPEMKADTTDSDD